MAQSARPPNGEVVRLFDVVDVRSILVTFPTLRGAIEWCDPAETDKSRAGSD